MRYLLALMMIGLLGLAACDLGAATPSEEPLPSIDNGAEESMDAESMDADASNDMSSSACHEVWHDVDVADVESVDDLEAIATDIETTLDECESLDEWRAEVEQSLPNVDTAAVEAWAAARCSENDTLSQSPVCVELNG